MPRSQTTSVGFTGLVFISQTIKATSPLGDPRVTYNLADGMVPETNMPVRFYLTPNREDGSASILVAEPLDYETTRNFMLRVRAQNVAAVPLAAFTTVYVNVTGVYLTVLLSFVRNTFKNHIDKYPRFIGISRNWLFSL